MKRRNVDTKARRPIKKIPKIYDSFYTGLVVYVKLALLWLAVMGGDFLLEFRLEYLYPIYLLIHNAYEAYKFQGVAFALLLVCIVVSVDVICLGAIPAPWLYLLGSLAVWSQVGWSLVGSPMGPLILIPTLIYLDAKSIRPQPSQTLSPLAAHCVGFPLVSLGFAVKSFVGTKLKQRTRNDVGRQNDLLFSILWDALPNIAPPPPLPAPVVNNNEVITNGSTVLVKKQQSPAASRRKSLENGDIASPKTEVITSSSPVGVGGGGGGGGGDCIPNGKHSSPHSITALSSKDNSSSSHHNHNHVNSSQNNLNNPNNNATSSQPTQYTSPCPTCAAALLAPKKKKEECCIKLESEVRRLRSDLHSVRSIESELRGQISSIQTSERNLRGDVALLQGEHEALQLKYSALQSKSQEERQSYEKKLMEERRQKDNAIKKQTKVTAECSGDCKRKLRDAEREKETLRREIKLIEDKTIRLERELQNVKSTLMLEQKNKESTADTAKLMSLLSALQDQNAHLESNLSAETRLKLDLFSALGEARRQLSIRDTLLKVKEEDLEELRSKYVELLAMSDFASHHSQQNSHMRQHPSMQQQPQTRLKSLMGVSVSDPPQSNQGNGTYSPLIES